MKSIFVSVFVFCVSFFDTEKQFAKRNLEGLEVVCKPGYDPRV